MNILPHDAKPVCASVADSLSDSARQCNCRHIERVAVRGFVPVKKLSESKLLGLKCFVYTCNQNNNDLGRAWVGLFLG
jgi:hypothetical protein